jgi:hypothetical protein
MGDWQAGKSQWAWKTNQKHQLKAQRVAAKAVDSMTRFVALVRGCEWLPLVEVA